MSTCDKSFVSLTCWRFQFYLAITTTSLVKLRLNNRFYPNAFQPSFRKHTSWILLRFVPFCDLFNFLAGAPWLRRVAVYWEFLVYHVTIAARGNRSAASCLCTVLRQALYHHSTRSPCCDSVSLQIIHYRHLARWETKRSRKTHLLEPLFESWDVKKVHAVCGAKHISQSKCTKHTMLGPLFGSCDVEKVRAVVARSTFRSQNVQNTPCSEHFWKLRCWKSARRHIEVKMYKAPHAAPLLEGPFERSRLRRFSGPRGSVGASSFVDDFVSGWGKRGAYRLLLWTHLKLASCYFVASGGLIVCRKRSAISLFSS